MWVSVSCKNTSTHAFILSLCPSLSSSDTAFHLFFSPLFNLRPFFLLPASLCVKKPVENLIALKREHLIRMFCGFKFRFYIFNFRLWSLYLNSALLTRVCFQMSHLNSHKNQKLSLKGPICFSCILFLSFRGSTIKLCVVSCIKNSHHSFIP